MAQVFLTSKREALSSNPSPAGGKKKKSSTLGKQMNDGTLMKTENIERESVKYERR
jgi:hypothetical protein